MFDRRNGWVRIALDNDGTRFGWVRESDQFHAIVDVLAGDSRLTYLTPTWDGMLFESPAFTPRGRNARTARPSDTIVRGNAEVPYRAIGRAVVQEYNTALLRRLHRENAAAAPAATAPPPASNGGVTTPIDEFAVP